MTPADYTAWRTRLRFNKTEAAAALQMSRNATAAYEDGKWEIPYVVALACAAIAHGLPPIGEQTQ